jgi:hypothetical protein
MTLMIGLALGKYVGVALFAAASLVPSLAAPVKGFQRADRLFPAGLFRVRRGGRADVGACDLSWYIVG